MAAILRFLVREFFIYFFQSLLCGALLGGAFATSMILRWQWDLIEEIFIVLFLGLISGFAFFPAYPFWCLVTLGLTRLVLSSFDYQFPTFGKNCLTLKASATVGLHLGLAYGIGMAWFYGFRFFLGHCPGILAMNRYADEMVEFPMHDLMLGILLVLAALGTSIGLWANEKWIVRRERSCQA